MTTAFDDGFAASGLPLLMAQCGQAVTYTPRVGDPVSITAIVGSKRLGEREVETGIDEDQDCTLTIGRDPTATCGGVAEPERGDTVTIGAVVWTVLSIDSQTGSASELGLALPARAEISKPAYRG